MYRYLILIILLNIGCNNAKITSDTVEEVSTTPKIPHDTIIKQYLENGAWKYGLYSQEWQNEIDKGLAIDSTIPYLWQQKAMPLFKQGKYQIAMDYLDRAVALDPQRWLDYRAFMKCVFAKRYREALVDFDQSIELYGNNFVMDHTYEFYRGLCYLQLNQFAKAEEILSNDIQREKTERGDDWVHHLDLFYLGITLFEQKKYEEAITTFDEALVKYPRFSDVIYYKALTLNKQGDTEQARSLIDQAKEYAKSGNTINEDNTAYERYPYQVRWQH